MDSARKLPSFLRYAEYPLHWQMAAPEKAALIQLLEAAGADVALEVGTYRGGSLQVLSPRARKVYSIDNDPQVARSLQGRFANVEFRTGDSSELVPQVLRQLDAAGESLGFVLIDGNHTTEGVRADIDHLLEYVPRRPVYVVMHDSFNPDCRLGMLRANWQGCPFVHYVEVDYQIGDFYSRSSDTALPGSMWGGLALAVLSPAKRQGELIIQESRKGVYDALFARSCHRRRFPFRRFLGKVKRRLTG